MSDKHLPCCCNNEEYQEYSAHQVKSYPKTLSKVTHFQENNGQTPPGLSDNAGRQILSQEPTFLSDTVQVGTNLLDPESVLIRDVSLYQTYAYVVTNVGENTATVSLRTQEMHKLVEKDVEPGNTVVLTPDSTLPHPVFDDLIYVFHEYESLLNIRFTGQLKGTLSGLPNAPYAWGSNISGQIGDSSRDIDRLLPVQSLRLAGVKTLAGGFSFTLALLSDGTVWAWGTNSSSQIGDGTEDGNRLIPKQVKGLNDIISIAAGDSFGMALRSDGTVFTWGNNVRGQLGDGTNTNRNTPVRVLGEGGSGFLSNISALAGGNRTSLALSTDKFVFAWGDNDDGQVGDGTTINRSTPVRVKTINNVKAIGAGGSHSLAVVE